MDPFGELMSELAKVSLDLPAWVLSLLFGIPLAAGAAGRRGGPPAVVGSALLAGLAVAVVAVLVHDAFDLDA